MDSMLSQVSEIVSPIYQVGGSVRDELMGVTPKDFDYATPLSPDEVHERVRAAGKRAYIVGKKFGTIGFKIDSQMIEVTTFREESYEAGTRKPLVTFVKGIKSDLSRRDFTLNAIARDVSGKLLDPFGGLKDIEDKQIRAVGVASERFRDDPLRLLRLVRFVGQFGFTVDPSTAKAARNKAYTILSVSRERWMMELDKIMAQDDPSIAFEAAYELDLLKFMIPELQIAHGYDQMSPYHEHDLWRHTMEVIRLIPKEDVNLRWVALFHDISKPFVATEKPFNPDIEMNHLPEMMALRKLYTGKMQRNFVHHERLSAEIAEKYASYFKWSNERKSFIVNNVRYHMEEDSILKPYDREGH